MRASQFFLSTLKEAPSDAEVISHKLMMRAGLIKRLAGGIYTWMPLGLRALRKVENIVREEMNRAGAIEVLMPAVQPAELWQESGRWDFYGPELLRFKDRHDRDFVIGPTHEEVITDVVRKDLRSYRQLPKHFYQIQTKFRDEIRPRFGVMRGREFTMKDGYSFHSSFEDLQREYRNMYDTYHRIFNRLGLKFRAVAADTGSIGGTGSHEFHVIAETGEDDIAYCPDSDYAANVELAEALAPTTPRPAAAVALTKVHTPGVKTIDELPEGIDLAVLAIPEAGVIDAIRALAQRRCQAAVLFASGYAEAGEEGQAKQLELARVAQQEPDLLSAVSSASAMWVANAATVCPSADSLDGRVHLTVANLNDKFHRASEAPTTEALLRAIFPDEQRFAIHPPLPQVALFGDEGAANHNRLGGEFGAPGVQLFVYGRRRGSEEGGNQ